ncbi:MAG: hypothetical protein ACP5RH_15575, partial [Leptodesmis sp.]
QTHPFHPLFLDRLSQFNTLRFMDWGATNNSPLVNWADRTTINSATQASNQGVALEYMIQLANTLKINPWFNIPAEASDDYVRQFATMVRDQLDPSLRVYIEYSTLNIPMRSGITSSVRPVMFHNRDWLWGWIATDLQPDFAITPNDQWRSSRSGKRCLGRAVVSGWYGCWLDKGRIPGRLNKF